jgi:hypothetical protein
LLPKVRGLAPDSLEGAPGAMCTASASAGEILELQQLKTSALSLSYCCIRYWLVNLQPESSHLTF